MKLEIMQKLRYDPDTGKFTPIPVEQVGFCSITEGKLEESLDKMAEIIPLLNYSPEGSDYQIWIPLPTTSYTGCKIPSKVLTAVARQIVLIFGGVTVVKDVQGLWLDENILYDESNHNVTIVVQGLLHEDLQKVTKQLAEILGDLLQQLSILVVVTPVYSAFYDTRKS